LLLVSVLRVGSSDSVLEGGGSFSDDVGRLAAVVVVSLLRVDNSDSDPSNGGSGFAGGSASLVLGVGGELNNRYYFGCSRDLRQATYQKQEK